MIGEFEVRTLRGVKPKGNGFTKEVSVFKQKTEG